MLTCHPTEILVYERTVGVLTWCLQTLYCAAQPCCWFKGMLHTLTHQWPVSQIRQTCGLLGQCVLHARALSAQLHTNMPDLEVPGHGPL